MDATACLGSPLAHGEAPDSSQGELTPSFTPNVLSPPPRVRLAQLAREAATECAKGLVSPRFEHRADGPHSGSELLAVLTFSYGTGIYTLERICEALQKDVLFCSLIGRQHPHPDTIRAFRRRERDTLRASLKRFFQLASALRDEHSDTTPDPADCSWLKALSLHHPLPSEPTRIDKLVNDRVNQATWIDRMMLDY